MYVNTRYINFTRGTSSILLYDLSLLIEVCQILHNGMSVHLQRKCWWKMQGDQNKQNNNITNKNSFWSWVLIQSLLSGGQVNYTDNTTFTGNDQCPVGYYCTNGTAYPIPCPIGTFSTQMQVTGPDGCEPCPRGRYCNVQAFTKVTQAPLCDAG